MERVNLSVVPGGVTKSRRRELVEAANRALAAWQLLFMKSPQLSVELAELWATILADAGVSPEEIDMASVKVASELRWWPTPADLIERVEAVRKERDRTEMRETLRRTAEAESRRHEAIYGKDIENEGL